MVDALARKVIHIEFPPVYNQKSKASANASLDFTPAGKDVTLNASTTVPPPLSDPQVPTRPRLPPPKEPQDFLPDLIQKNLGSKFKLRDDIKPLHVVQPEGVSFKMNGNELEWQKWKMHIGLSLCNQYLGTIMINLIRYRALVS